MENNLKIIGKNIAINTKTGIKYKLNDTAEHIVEEVNNCGFSHAIKRLSKYYSVDEGVIKEDILALYKRTSECRAYEIGSLPYRDYVVLEPTNDCTASCIHCFHRDKAKFSWNKLEIEKYIELLKREGISAVSLTGGEIFSPHYIDKAKYLIQKLILNNIKICTISTNGMFLTKDLVEWLVDNIDINRTIMRISLDSIGEKNVIKMRPGYVDYYNTSFWKYMNKYNFQVIVTTIISTQKENDILDISKFLANQKCVIKWIVKPLVPTKKGHFKLIDWGQIRRNYCAFLEWYKENLHDVKYDFILGNTITKKMLINEDYNKEICFGEHPCKEEMYQKTIKANGKITRCPMLPDISDEFQLSISELGKRNDELFDNLTIRDMDCMRCNYHSVCGGGCRAYAIAYYGDYKKCDINSKRMIDWIVNDEYFKKNWSFFYRNMVKKIEDGIS